MITWLKKWENELAKKFGFRNFFKDITLISNYKEKKIHSEILPKVYTVKSKSDLYTLIYNAYNHLYPEGETFDSRIRKSAIRQLDLMLTPSLIDQIKEQINLITEKITSTNHKSFKMAVIKQIYAPLIEKLVFSISSDLGFKEEFKASNYQFNTKGQYYHIIDMLLDSPIKSNNSIMGIYERILDKEIITKSIVNEFDFIKKRTRI